MVRSRSSFTLLSEGGLYRKTLGIRDEVDCRSHSIGRFYVCHDTRSLIFITEMENYVYRFSLLLFESYNTLFNDFFHFLQPLYVFLFPSQLTFTRHPGTIRFL